MKTPIEQLIEDLIKHDLIKADGFTTTLMLKAKQVEYEQILNTHKWAKFFTSGEEIEYPGDPNAKAGNVINCRCKVVFTIKEDADGLPIRKIK